MKEAILYKFLPSVLACAVAVAIVVPCYEQYIKPKFQKANEDEATDENANA